MCVPQSRGAGDQGDGLFGECFFPEQLLATPPQSTGACVQCWGRGHVTTGHLGLRDLVHSDHARAGGAPRAGLCLLLTTVSRDPGETQDRARRSPAASHSGASCRRRRSALGSHSSLLIPESPDSIQLRLPPEAEATHSLFEDQSFSKEGH